jgi:hypothetical protein
MSYDVHVAVTAVEVLMLLIQRNCTEVHFAVLGYSAHISLLAEMTANSGHLVV